MDVDCLASFDQAEFLGRFWQKRPCLIRNWLDPRPQSLTGLLDLAEQHDLPQRLVTGNQAQANWTLTHGPLMASELPNQNKDWTVLVQEVDKVNPEVAAILAEFRFLPDWMIDDVMISQAVDGGSVGAHVDAYDVFLVQAQGRRQWQLATGFDPSLDQRFELALLRHWLPETELLALSGDVLYLPAGIAHHGVAIGDCQTWSVGLRTPSGPELMFALAEMLAEQTPERPRLRVSGPDPAQPSRLGHRQIEQIRGLLEDCLRLDDEALADLAAGFLSRWRLWPEQNEPDELQSVMRALSNGLSLALAASARIALTGQGERLKLFVNGEQIDCPAELAARLARLRRIDASWLDQQKAIGQLLELDALASVD
jgi:50S ribosomal protein L16 3-hydroxylase